MTRQAYTNAVLSQVRRLTDREREAVHAEIDGHIEDHMGALLDLGYDWDLANERTMDAMGDPAEVGREIDKQYPLRWLILSRIALGLLVAVCTVVLLSGPNLDGVRMNLQARFAPLSLGETKRAAEQGYRLAETDVRVSVGNDIWYIYASGTRVNGIGEGEAELFTCWYDRNPFGRADGEDWSTELTDCRGGNCGIGGGGGFSNGCIATSRMRCEVQAGDPYVTVRCERFGEVYEAQVPLEWEAVA